MIRIWVRHRVPKQGRQWEALGDAEDLDEAIRRVFTLGPRDVRLTDEVGAELVTLTVRAKAVGHVARPRLRLKLVRDTQHN